MIHFLRLHHGGKHNFDHLAVLWKTATSYNNIQICRVIKSKMTPNVPLIYRMISVTYCGPWSSWSGPCPSSSCQRRWLPWGWPPGPHSPSAAPPGPIRDEYCQPMRAQHHLVLFTEGGEGWESVGYPRHPLHLQLVTLQRRAGAHLHGGTLEDGGKTGKYWRWN